MNCNVCVVIVTYGNRFKFLKEVVDACTKENFYKIIIVDNASEKESKRKLRDLEIRLQGKLKVIYLKENIGSAGGFKKGFQEAYKINECEYILALDDDNLIPKGFLKKVESVISYLGEDKKEIMLSMYRPIWDWDKKAILEGWVKSYKKNNFMGLNFFSYIYEKLNLLKIFPKKNVMNISFPIVPVQVTAMGGLFFHKSILNFIGYPNEDYFLYADDHEFTYRFTKKNGKIYLCSKIVIKDIDFSHFNKDGEKINFFHRDFSEKKLYYSVRNHTNFSKQFITRKIFFYGNMLFYLILLSKYFFRTSPLNFFKRYRLILRAIFDGLMDRLGKTF